MDGVFTPTRLEISQLLGNVGFGQPSQAWKAAGRHAFAVGAVAGHAWRGCRVGATFLHDVHSICRQCQQGQQGRQA